VFAVLLMPRGSVVQAQGASTNGLSVLPVRGGIYMISGPTSNTTVQVGRDGVLVVDTQTEALGDALLARIRTLSDKPIRMIVNTGIAADHIGGNTALKKSGQILSGGNQRAAAVYGNGGSPIYAHENVLTRLTQANSDAAGWPTDTYFVAQKDMFFNGEPVQLMHAPSAHSDGDTLVVFRRTDVISVGNIYTPDRYPVIDTARGGTIDGVVAALNRIIDLTVPEFNEEGGTMVVPGRGYLADEADVAEYRDMVTIVRDRVRDMVKKGMSIDQVKASKPTGEYDVVYGEHESQAFIEAVYRTLAPAAAKPAPATSRGRSTGDTK
jgi:glyoxylase-like metal-dependent hydrolase (beta-lactamase superfamily II)